MCKLEFDDFIVLFKLFEIVGEFLKISMNSILCQWKIQSIETFQWSVKLFVFFLNRLSSNPLICFEILSLKFQRFFIYNYDII